MAENKRAKFIRYTCRIWLSAVRWW